MAVNSNTIITQAEMDALAAIANSKSSLSFASINIGKYFADPITISNPGTGYKAGDSISILSCQFIVQTASATGQIIGIKIDNNGAEFPAPANGVRNVSGGSGTGASLNLTWVPYNAVSGYNFAGYVWGKATSFLVKAGGTGYSIGDIISLTLPYPITAVINATVLAVDGTGAITAISTTWAGSTSATAIEDNVLSATSMTGTGTGAILWLLYTQNRDPQWATELARMRADVNTTLAPQSNSYVLSISGASTDTGKLGWPVPGPSLTYKNLSYYHTGTPADTVSLQAVMNVSSCVDLTSSIMQIANWHTLPSGDANQFNVIPIRVPTQATGRIRVDSGKPVFIQADFYFAIQTRSIFSGTLSPLGGSTGPWGFTGIVNEGGDPTSLVSIITDLGIGTQETTVIGGFVFVVWHVNQYVNPGVYTATVSCATSSDAAPAAGPYTTQLFAAFCQPFGGGYDFYLVTGAYMSHTGGTTGPGSGGPSFSPAIWTNGVPVNGIHSSKQIYRIDTYTNPDLVVDSVYFDSTNIDANLTPIPPVITVSAGVQFTWAESSPYGLWLAQCPMVSGGFVFPSQMPWNLLRHTPPTNGVFNPVNPTMFHNQCYNQGAVREYQLEPPPWKPATFVIPSPGNDRPSIVSDSYGNFWQCFQSNTDSLTGGTTPFINQTPMIGSLVVDNHITWICIRVADLTTPYVSAIHRLLSIPRYPFYWYTETNLFLKPPPVGGTDPSIWGSKSQWEGDTFSGQIDAAWGGSNIPPNNNNQAYGWWIYKVAINRYGTAAGLSVPQSTQIPVTIGCIRSGVFKAFGTYMTGQIIDAMWPVFTSDALVYQAAERVDIQAACVHVPIATGTGIAYPVMASEYNDTETLLGMIT